MLFLGYLGCFFLHASQKREEQYDNEIVYIYSKAYNYRSPKINNKIKKKFKKKQQQQPGLTVLERNKSKLTNIH